MSLHSNEYGRATHQGMVQLCHGFSYRKGPLGGDLSIDDLTFAVVGHTPEVMGKGNWSVGIIVDNRASSDQKQAIATIASGMAGGPPAILAGVIGKVLGVESASIEFSKNGFRRGVRIPNLLELSCEGVPGGVNPNEPLTIENTMHPANPRLALAKSIVSRMHIFGLNWEDTSGNNNGHFAPFNWSN